MGKSLKGKELGKGIGQRKDGLYYARCVGADGLRSERCFANLTQARNWQKEQQYYALKSQRTEDKSSMTVDAWFCFWQDNLLTGLSPNTVRNYRERYERNAKPVLGHLLLTEVRPMHCKAVFNRMHGQYAGSTVRQAYITMGTMFKSAKENGLIDRHPMDGVRFDSPLKAPDEIHYLTEDEQCRFMEVAKRSHNYAQYALILETGLRTGELIGLTWDDIDWERRTLTVCKSMEFRYDQKNWRAGPTKTRKSYRTIPLTDTAYRILQELYDVRFYRKESPELDQHLSYLNRRTGRETSFCMRDLVFVNWRTGKPAKNSSYDTQLYKLCDEAGIEHFSMHALRHTYATRAIERGMRPEILKRLLGHESIKTTMDKYVHVTDDSLFQAVYLFQSNNTSETRPKGEQKGE